MPPNNHRGSANADNTHVRFCATGRSYHRELTPIKGVAMYAKIIGNTMPVLEVTLNRGKRVGVPPPDAALPEPPPARHALPPPPWYRRPGIAIAAAALIAEVGITGSGWGKPGTAPGGATGTSTPRSASFSLIATGWWEPDQTGAPAAAPPTAAPPAAEPPAAAPPAAPPPVAAPPSAVPPPPPPSNLLVSYDNTAMAVVVTITNNANNSPVSCVYRSVAVAGPATTVNYDHSDNFTVTGSAPTPIPYHGPATGSTFHNTVTCDNGLSNIQDMTY